MTAPNTAADLPEADREYLNSKGYDYEVTRTSGVLHVTLRGFELPSMYMPRECELLVRLPPGYPNGNPDMFWTRPDVKLENGNWPTNADSWQDFAGVRWQRWSRHFPDGRWRAGIDGLDTFMAAVRRELALGR